MVVCSERRWRRFRAPWAARPAPASRVRSCPRRAASLLVVGTLAFGRPAYAGAADIELAWQAPPECPDRVFVLSRVREIVGENAQIAIPVEADARIAKKNRYELTVTTRRGGVVEARSASSSSCAALAEAAAIIVALAADTARGSNAPSTGDLPPGPSATNEPRLKSPTSEANVSAEVRAPPPTRTEHAPPEPTKKASRSRLSLGLGAGLVFDIGTLPKPAFGVDGQALATVGALELGLHGGLMAEVEERYSAATGAGARFNLFDLGVFACFAPSLGRWRVGACAAADATWMQIEGLDIRQPARTTLRWPTLRVGALGEYAIARRLVAFARADTAFAFGAPPVVLTTATTDVVLHEVSVPALRLSLGLRADIF